MPAWLQDPVRTPDGASQEAARLRQTQLTKPPGALGRLEELAIQLAGLQGQTCPVLDRVGVVVFAGDHGVAQEGVSAFPQEVTVEMVRNFSRGGAAISVLAQHLRARLEVVDVGTVTDPGTLAGVVSHRAGSGTENFRRQAAMSETQLATALQAGRDAVLRMQQQGIKLFIGGEMGIANTTSATAIACALLQLPAQVLAGPGTGLDHAGVQHKAQLIDAALQLHRPDSSDVCGVLRCVGGFEIAALAGAYLSCAQSGIPVIIDGFISTIAALAAVRIQPEVGAWLLFSHCSAEPGHKKVLEALRARPLLDLEMRLGEGSGAAVAVPLLQQACALHAGMATFAEAGVSGA